MTFVRAAVAGMGLAVSLGLCISVLNGLWAYVDKDSYTWTKRSSVLFNGSGN